MITLYHGTSTKYLQAIISSGLMPRYESESNWENAPSRKDMVYLTNSYAPYFAQQSVPVGSEYQPVVFKVQLSDKICDKRLYPDEDYLEQIARNHPEGLPQEYLSMDMKQRTEFFRERLEHYKIMYANSIQGLGTCAYKGVIPPKFITSYTILDADRILEYSDPTITLMNQRLLADKYQNACNQIIWEKPFSLGVYEV